MRVRKLAAAALALLLLCLLIAAQKTKPAALPGSVVAQDSFNGPDGTTLESHSADTGQGYFRPPYSRNSTVYLYGNQAVHGAVPFRSIYLMNATPAPDCYVKAKITIRDSVTPALIIRANPISEQYLAASYDVKRQQWIVFLNQGYAGETALIYVLGTWPETIAQGQARTVKFQAVSDELTLIIDGVARIEAESYALTGAGYAGLGLAESSSAQGTSIDDLEIGNVVEGYPSPSPSPVGTPCNNWRLTTDTATRKVWDCY